MTGHCRWLLALVVLVSGCLSLLVTFLHTQLYLSIYHILFSNVFWH